MPAGAGVHLRRRLRLGLATDGLIALGAGCPSAAIGSVTKCKPPLNHRSPRDTAGALHSETVRDAAVLCEALVRDAGVSLRRPAAGAPARRPARGC